MTKAMAIIGLATASALAAGCGPSIASPPDSDQPLEPDATGWVDRSTTGTTGIEGQWHAYADPRFGVPAGDCQTTAYGECSIVDEPAPGSTFTPTAGLGMCTSGIIARWISGSRGLTPDGSPAWAGIVLELGMASPPGQPYDAVAHGVTGFSFDIDSEPAAGAGLLVTTVEPGESSPGSKPVYWGGARQDASPVHAGHNEFTWKDVGPGSFDGTRLLRLGFLVSGNDSEAVSYNFCIDHLTALRASGESPQPRPGQILVPDPMTGFVARHTTGTTNIQGNWIAESDGVTPDGMRGGICPTAGYADCSAFIEPDPAGHPLTYLPTEDLGMCTSGRVAQVPLKADGVTPDWSSVWGAMIAFTLNLADPGGSGYDKYDADRYGVTGFAFDIDSEPAPDGGIRVNITTPETVSAAAFWGGRNATANFSPVHAGHNEFRWADVGGPPWVTDPPRLDTTRLSQIIFQVPASDTHAVSYSFCINNLTALQN
jgi:hypothetical protein